MNREAQDLSPEAIRAGQWLAAQCGDTALHAPASRLWQSSEDGHTAMPLTELGPDSARLLHAAPFVVVADGWAAIARLDRAERQLADWLAPRLDHPSGPVPAGVDAWFAPDSAEHLHAVTTALRRRLCLITGGPGTGKTFALQRLLAAMLSESPQTRIAIAAPTGKAARRAREA